jgi:NifU-like protein involved in Fe-S cluster formation
MKTLNAYMEIGYSEKAVLLIQCNQNIGRIDNADISYEYQSDCGDILVIYIVLNNQLIIDAKYEYIGCMGLQVAASGMIEMIRGLTIEQANCITFNDLLSFLGSVPNSKYECLQLALNTLKSAIKEFMGKRKKRVEKKTK